jgi:hypothetical protein
MARARPHHVAHHGMIRVTHSMVWSNGVAEEAMDHAVMNGSCKRSESHTAWSSPSHKAWYGPSHTQNGLVRVIKHGMVRVTYTMVRSETRTAWCGPSHIHHGMVRVIYIMVWFESYTSWYGPCPSTHIERVICLLYTDVCTCMLCTQCTYYVYTCRQCIQCAYADHVYICTLCMHMHAMYTV